MHTLRRFLLRIVSLFRSGGAEADLAREVESHLRLIEDEFIVRGMSAEEARYAARRSFGGVEQVKERQRDARSFRWLAGWSMDMKLGIRMLAKYPGLTIVGGLAMAFAIAIGAAGFEGLTQLLSPSLPLDDGDRIIGIRQWDVENNREQPATAADFADWRDQLQVIETIGAFRTIERNLVIDGGATEPLTLAEISASAFDLAAVQPLIGRRLAGDDERPGAPLVVVIGQNVWQQRFGADPSVLGRTVRLGNVPYVIVGVMPTGFAFPVYHSAWIPLRLGEADLRGEGPDLEVFGRLASGVSMAHAQAAALAVGARASAARPATHAHLRAEVVPFARSIMDLREVALGGTAFNLFLVMFLVLVCANVAALVFARAVTRENEILVRNALGASRGRIVVQLFAEALVLGGLAACVGLAAATFALRWWMAVSLQEAGGRLPFWLDANLSPRTMLYTAGLTLLGSAIAGVIPALKVTGRRLEGRLREAAAGGTDFRFGGVWTFVIITQVAVTVAFPATAFHARRYVTGIQSIDPGVAARRYLTARLEIDESERAGFASALEELERRLEADPAVASVTFATALPRISHPRRIIEVDGVAVEKPYVTIASVAADYFDALDAAPLAGRRFTPSDLLADARTVIVNHSFAERVLGGRNAIGQRLRYAAANDRPASPWFEVVGVVRDLGMVHDDASNGAGVYHPLRPSQTPMRMAIHLKGEPEAFTSQLRSIAGAVNPALRLYDVLALDKVGATLWLELDFLFRLLVLVSGVALLLSLAGIYSVMSLTVSRRTREIGIRVALGADARRIVRAVFSRAIGQVGIGVLIGGALVFALTAAIGGLAPLESIVIVVYMAVMLCVCLLACVVPTRRALTIEPTQALRAG